MCILNMGLLLGIAGHHTDHKHTEYKVHMQLSNTSRNTC